VKPSRNGGRSYVVLLGGLALCEATEVRIDCRLNIILVHKSHGEFGGDRSKIRGVVVVGNGVVVDMGCREIVIGRGSIGCGVNPSTGLKWRWSYKDPVLGLLPLPPEPNRAFLHSN